MEKYKLSISSLSDGEFHLESATDCTGFSNMAQLIKYLSTLDTQALEAEPSYAHIANDDRETIEAVREVLLKHKSASVL